MKKNTKTLGLPGIIGIMLASSMTIMVGSAVTSAIPDIGLHFDMGNMASWLVTIPALGVVIGAIPCGKFLNKHGAYTTCILGLVLYGLFGIAGAYMPGKISEIVVRFLLGIATALVMTSSTALISIFYKGEKQLRMIAIQGMAIEFGGVIFLSVSGHLALYSWRYPYFIYGISFLALILLALFVPGTALQQMDPQEKNEKAEKKNAEKTDNRQVYPVLVLAFTGMIIFFTAIVSLPSYLQNERGYSTAFTGNYLACISLIAVVFAGIMPGVVKKISAKGSLSIAYGCYGLAHLLLFFSSASAFLYLAVLFMGIGFGFSTPLVNNLTVERSNENTKPKNLSYYSMATFLGQFLSSLLASAIQGRYVYLGACGVALATCAAVVLFFKNTKSIENE